MENLSAFLSSMHSNKYLIYIISFLKNKNVFHVNKVVNNKKFTYEGFTYIVYKKCLLFHAFFSRQIFLGINLNVKTFFKRIPSQMSIARVP